MSSKARSRGYDEEDNPPTPSDVSDFDDDDDPDNLEVPGGGKTLAAAAAQVQPKTPNPVPTTSGMPVIRHMGATPATSSIAMHQKSIPRYQQPMGKPMGINPLLSMVGGSVPTASASASASQSTLAAYNAASSLFAQMDMAGFGMGMNPYLLQNLNQILASGMGGPFASMLNQLGGMGGFPNLPNTLNWAGKPNMWGADKLATGEEEEADDDEMGVAETYADYMPTKLKIGKKHPDPVVETASLSSVEPIDVNYKLSLPEETIRTGALSALQLESVVYASQAHQNMLADGTRAGFLVGDGAGVGKGRTIAGIIFENFLKGRKRAIWISVSNDLKYDAERDLRDIGADLDVHSLSKLKYAKISSGVNGNLKKGVIFSTYSALIGESQSTNGKYKTRLKQLLQWCGEDFDGVIVFDECHKAKNLCPVGSSKPTKTGLTALELQNKLPKARIVYASATGASEPRNMAYMVRLGIWGEGTPFPNFMDFINAVEKRGVGAMEIVAMDMKLRGMYIARQLSFHGVTFKIEEVPLTEKFKETYDKSVALWVVAMQKFTEAAELIDAESRMRKTMWGQFWSAHQRFFKYLCIAAKVSHAVAIAREAVKCGKCVVIGLQSTGEARTLDQLERDDGELTDFVSTAKDDAQHPFKIPGERLHEKKYTRPTPHALWRPFSKRKHAQQTGNGNQPQEMAPKSNKYEPETILVEKHFPAPDRNRINRLLGMEPSKPVTTPITTVNGNKKNGANNVKDEDTGTKRKLTARQLVNKAAAAKRARGPSSSASSSGEGSSSDEAAMSESDENSDDFNPFIASGSDSDEDPWITRHKKKVKKTKKSKKEKKKATSTAERIEELIGKKRNAAPANAVTVTTPQGATLTGTPIGTNGIYLGPPRNQPPPRDAIERACSMKEELLAAIEKLGQRLPANTLDQLIDELGGSENVAEMTGRKGRVVQTESGQILYESRSEADIPLETLNLTEKKRFMDGEKDVAIISEAASSGISLQSDRRARNQRRRVHITLELPWSADRAVQQFGRTHRSNQVNAPEYIFLISDLAGERRFASTVAKRLESLGALTHGDRRATETRDLSQFNIDNKYGRTALEAVMRAIMKYETPIVPPPSDYRGDFFQDVAAALVGVGLIVNSEASPGVLSLDKDYNNISKFLNRILGMPVELQNRLFKYFTDTLTAVMESARKTGRFDLGILDVGSSGENVQRVSLTRYLRKHATGVAPTDLHTLTVERGMDWDDAMNKWGTLQNPKEGFYLSLQARNNHYTVVLAVAVPPKKPGEKQSKKEQMFQIYRPNTGLQMKNESLAELEKKYKRVGNGEAEAAWRQHHAAALATCSHNYWRGSCRNPNCEIGRRRRTYHVLGGSVLGVWGRVEAVLAQRSALNKMQVVRLKTGEGEKIVGTLIPKNCVDELKKALAADAEKVEEKNYLRAQATNLDHCY